jgi:hypothetical protein
MKASEIPEKEREFERERAEAAIPRGNEEAGRGI